MSDYTEKFVVTVMPTEESGEDIGIMNWFHDESNARETYNLWVKGSGDNNIIALWNAHVPTEWDADTITDYLDDTFMGETPEGFPILAHNTSHPEWPHIGEDRD